MADTYDRYTGWRNSLASGGVVGLAGVVARRGVARWEEEALRSVNGLPDVLHGPVWPVMQFGSLASVGVVAALAYRNSHPRHAAGVAVAGGGAWLVCKPLKRLVRRPRPDPQDPGIRIRGPAQTGLGYPSGHAAVAAAMGAVLAWDASSAERVGLATLAGAVGMSRMYVGAHYPLNVAGGWAVGLLAGMVGQRLLR